MPLLSNPINDLLATCIEILVEVQGAIANKLAPCLTPLLLESWAMFRLTLVLGDTRGTPKTSLRFVWKAILALVSTYSTRQISQIRKVLGRQLTRMLEQASVSPPFSNTGKLSPSSHRIQLHRRHNWLFVLGMGIHFCRLDMFMAPRGL